MPQWRRRSAQVGHKLLRYGRISSDNVSAGGNAYYDGLLDDGNFMSLGRGGFCEYYCNSHYAAGRYEEELSDATLLATTTALALSGREKNDQQSKVEDWISIAVGALDKYLKEIPIHECLKLPYHIGKHLEDLYGVDIGGGGTKRCWLR